MKSTQQIIDRIDRHMGYALERPRNYAMDAYDLERRFFNLDDVREYALSDDEDNDVIRSRYPRYLGEHGYGAALFMTRKDLDDPVRLRDDAKDLRDFIDFWRGYLAWRDQQ
jgi:hypothetical protein